MGERRGLYRVLVRKSEGKRPLGRPKHIREDNIKMDIQEVGCAEIGVDRDRGRALVNAVMKLAGYIKCGEFIDWLRTG